MKVNEVSQALRDVATPERARSNAWFFKTGKGQYGYGDKFLGVTVPEQRKVAKHFYRDISLDGVEQLLRSSWHEERLTALFMLVLIFQKGTDAKRDEVTNLYLANTKYVNNWDLVDSSASYILGPWLENSPYKMKLLRKMANSKDLWERRIAMLTTYYDIGKGKPDSALEIAEILVNDSHDLIQKAVGWMLREIGKRVDIELLRAFLDKHASTMPRTALRYAIEKLSTSERHKYMNMRQW